MSLEIDIIQFLTLNNTMPVIDVRSPAEYHKGHIPGSINIALFSDEERVKIGTSYAKRGKEESFLLGLEIIGPKLKHFASKALDIAVDKKILVHCWRGGMRSNSMAWLFEQMGIYTYRLKGGYKSYRRYALEWFNKQPGIIVLGGMTGTGKTDILKEIRRLGQQVLDMEAIANHKGSAFGGIGQLSQPSQEQFENNLFTELQSFDYGQTIWVEDESLSIGRVQLPKQWFEYMLQSKVICVWLDKETRIRRLIEEYAGFSSNLLAESICKIEKKLGGDNTKAAIDALSMGNYYKVAEITLRYYDKAYQKHLAGRPQENIINHNPLLNLPNEIANEIIRLI